MKGSRVRMDLPSAAARSRIALSVALVLLAAGAVTARPLSERPDASDPSAATGVEPPPPRIVARPRLDVRFSAAQPFGDWRYHPLATTEHAPDDLVLFGPALGFEVEYTLQWLRGSVAGWSTGLIVQGLFFDTGDWVSHAAGNGPPVDASAMLLGVHFQGGYRLLHGRRLNLDVSVGLGGLYPSGREVIDLGGESVSFDYPFLHIAPSTRLALAASLAVSDVVDVVLEVNQLSGFSAVEHAGRDAEGLFVVGASLGSRFWLGGRP